MASSNKRDALFDTLLSTLLKLGGHSGHRGHPTKRPPLLRRPMLVEYGRLWVTTQKPWQRQSFIGGHGGHGGHGGQHLRDDSIQPRNYRLMVARNTTINTYGSSLSLLFCLPNSASRITREALVNAASTTGCRRSRSPFAWGR